MIQENLSSASPPHEMHLFSTFSMHGYLQFYNYKVLGRGVDAIYLC